MGMIEKKNNEVYVTKAKCHIDVPMNVIHNVYWNWESDWDSSTVAHIKVIEDGGNNRLLMKEHKTTSAATLKNDLVVRQIYEDYGDHIWCYAVSEKCTTVPEKGGYRRGQLVLSGFLIQPEGGDRCEVSFINCFDFGGFIHVKFIDEEQKRVAILLSRIKIKSEEKYAKELSKASQQQSSKPQYRQPESITVMAEPVNLPPPTSDNNYSNTAVCYICPTCNTSSNAKFCGNDGTRLELICSNCRTPVSGAKFCSSCGSKLVS